MLKMSYPETPATAQDLTLIQWAPAPPLESPSAPRPGCHHRDVAPTQLQHLGLGLVPAWFPRAESPINTLPGLQRGTSGEAEGPQLDPLQLCGSWGHLGCVCSLMGRPVAAGQGRVPRGCPRVYLCVYLCGCHIPTAVRAGAPARSCLQEAEQLGGPWSTLEMRFAAPVSCPKRPKGFCACALGPREQPPTAPAERSHDRGQSLTCLRPPVPPQPRLRLPGGPRSSSRGM